MDQFSMARNNRECLADVALLQCMLTRPILRNLRKLNRFTWATFWGAKLRRLGTWSLTKVWVDTPGSGRKANTTDKGCSWDRYLLMMTMSITELRAMTVSGKMVIWAALASLRGQAVMYMKVNGSPTGDTDWANFQIRKARSDKGGFGSLESSWGKRTQAKC